MNAQKKQSKLKPFVSMKALCRAHSSLKKRRYQHGVEPHLLRDVDLFVRSGRLTGTILNDEADRWYAQSILDYWANVLYGANWPEPNVTLAPFRTPSLQLAL